MNPWRSRCRDPAHLQSTTNPTPIHFGSRIVKQSPEPPAEECHLPIASTIHPSPHLTAQRHPNPTTSRDPAQSRRSYRSPSHPPSPTTINPGSPPPPRLSRAHLVRVGVSHELVSRPGKKRITGRAPLSRGAECTHGAQNVIGYRPGRCIDRLGLACMP